MIEAFMEMIHRARIYLIVLFMIINSCTESETIKWDNSIILPECVGMKKNVGLAGSWSGLLPDGSLAVLGGTNFPDCYPWENGIKHWWTTLYVYDFKEKSWDVFDEFLDEPYAYGTSIQLNDGILCIGGCNSTSCTDNVFFLTMRNGKVVIDKNRYPSLPFPLANSAGTLIGRSVYLAGGQSSVSKEESLSVFLKLDLDNLEDGWQELPTWPGHSRAYSVAVAQQGDFYLFSGRSFAPGEETIEYMDGYKYNPDSGMWVELQGDFPYMAGTAIPYGDGDILFLGGVDCILPTNPDHPGFSHEIILYKPDSGIQKQFSSAPVVVPVTTHVVCRPGEFLITSGEVAPGIRTPNILRGMF